MWEACIVSLRKIIAFRTLASRHQDKRKKKKKKAWVIPEWAADQEITELSHWLIKLPQKKYLGKSVGHNDR